MCFSPQRHTIFRHLNFQKCSEDYSFLTFWLPNVLFATAAYNFSTSELQKALRGLTVFCNILTSQMCFSPHRSHRRTIFRHLNFKKCSETVSFLSIFTSKCAFRHSGVQFFDIWTSKSAPKLTCFVHFDFTMCFSPQRRAIFGFLLWAPTSAPAALTGLLFDWPDTRIIEKTQHFATSLTFASDVSSFFWLSR